LVSASVRQNIDFAARILLTIRSGVPTEGILSARVSCLFGHGLTCSVVELDGLGDNTACTSSFVNQENVRTSRESFLQTCRERLGCMLALRHANGQGDLSPSEGVERVLG
jgi:hypothetical protein